MVYSKKKYNRTRPIHKEFTCSTGPLEFRGWLQDIIAGEQEGIEQTLTEQNQVLEKAYR